MSASPQIGGSTTLSVTGNAKMRTGDGASMRRGDLKRELIRARRRSHENGNRQRLMTHRRRSEAVAYPEPRRRWRLMSPRRRRKSWLLCLGEGRDFWQRKHCRTDFHAGNMLMKRKWNSLYLYDGPAAYVRVSVCASNRRSRPAEVQACRSRNSDHATDPGGHR